jgi:zinc protease
MRGLVESILVRSGRAAGSACLVVLLSSVALPRALAAPGVPESRTLANGLKVVVLEDHTLPLTAVSLWIGSGSKNEIETSAGYAHFLEHLIQRGTGTSGPFEYQKRAYRWGGSISVRANYDRTYLTATGVSSMVAEQLGAVADMALSAKLDNKEIDLELGTLSQEVHSYYDDPSTVAFLEAMRAAFPKHPYRFPPLGNLKTIGTLKHDPLSAFYKNLYVPNNMALALAGDLDPERAFSLAEKVFGKVAASATLPEKAAPLQGFTGHDDKEKPLDLREPWTTLTFVGPGYRHPDRPAFEILARALGEAGRSPIQAALVRDRTGVQARVSYYRLEEAGLLYVGTVPGTPEMSYAAATSALKEIAAFKKRGMKDEEVRLQVRRLLFEERLKAEHLTDRSESLGEAALFGGVRYYWDLPDVYTRLTAAEVNRVAAKYLVGENLRLVVIVPKTAPPSRQEDKDAFHAAMEELGGVAADAPAPAFQAAFYTPEEASRLRPEAWGNPRDARAANPAVRAALDNGLGLVVQEDHRNSLLAVSLHLPFGSGQDPAGKEGLVHVAAHLLPLAPPPSPRGGNPGAAERPIPLPDVLVSRDLTEIRFRLEPADLKDGLQALAGWLRRVAPTEASFAAVRSASRQALERAESDPSFLTLELFREKVYAGHPYAHPSAGRTTGLDALSLADVEGFLKRRLAPRGAVLAIAGDVVAADARKIVEDLFGDWKNPKGGDGPVAAGGPAVERAQSGEFTRLVTAPQSTVLVGVPAVSISDPGFDDVRLLGAALTVLSFEDMVFGRRAAFSASAVPEALRDGGALAIVVVTQHGRRDEAVFDVQRLMRRLASDGLDQKDVDDFARVDAARETSDLQGVAALASNLAYREVTGLASRTRTAASAPPPAPSAARLKEMATRLLRPESWIVVKAGPTSN